MVFEQIANLALVVRNHSLEDGAPGAWTREMSTCSKIAGAAATT